MLRIYRGNNLLNITIFKQHTHVYFMRKRIEKIDKQKKEGKRTIEEKSLTDNTKMN